MAIEKQKIKNSLARQMHKCVFGKPRLVPARCGVDSTALKAPTISIMPSNLMVPYLRAQSAVHGQFSSFPPVND